jgi:hypothetical protein
VASMHDRAWAATSVIGALSELRKTSDGMLLTAAVIRQTKEENEFLIGQIKDLNGLLERLAIKEYTKRENSS